MSDPILYWPLNPSSVSEWPASPGRPKHAGTDFKVPQGTPLRAPMSGRVTRHYNDGLGAQVLDITAPSGFLSRQGHMLTLDAPDDEWINAGEYIGLSGGAPGTTGAGFSTGPHLHWELRRWSAWVGPGWVDPRSLDIRSFAELDSAGKDNIMGKLFGGTATLSAPQVLEPGKREQVKFLDNHSDSPEYGNVTIARGPGEIRACSAEVLLSGTAGDRVALQMVVERKKGDPNARVVSRDRVVIDGYGQAVGKLLANTGLARGELVRVYAQVEKRGKRTTVLDFSWTGDATPAKG